jgi:hypothetical protein
MVTENHLYLLLCTIHPIRWCSFTYSLKMPSFIPTFQTYPLPQVHLPSLQSFPSNFLWHHPPGLRCLTEWAGKCLTATSPGAFLDFCGVNISTITDLKLPTSRPWMHNWEKDVRSQSPKPVQLYQHTTAFPTLASPFLSSWLFLKYP